MNYRFFKLLESIDNPLNRDTSDLSYLEWLVEDHYSRRLDQCIEYFNDRPDFLKEEKAEVELELARLLEFFIEKEEYEKCAKIKETIESLISVYSFSEN